MLIIRLANRDDAELVADMSRQTFYDSFAADNSQENMDKFLDQQFTRDKLIEEVGAPHNIFLLAFESGAPVGYARLREHNNPPELGNQSAIEIARLYAVQPAIGKGVGSALMRECVEVAMEKHVQWLWLGVWEHNQRAITFYRKWGFDKFSDHEFILGDDVQNDWLMKKRIQAG